MADHLAEAFPTFTLEVDFPDDTLAIPYRAQVLNSQPGAYYRVQEASGASAAEEQGLAAGTIPGGSTYHQSSPVASDDYAIALGGVFVSGVAFSATLTDLSAQGVAIGGWYKVSSLAAARTLVTTTNANAPCLELGTDGKVYITKSDTGVGKVAGTTVFSTGQWLFAVLVLDIYDPAGDTTGHLYVNGVQEATRLNLLTDGWANAKPRHGGSVVTLDEPVQWQRQIAAGEVAAMFGAANPASFVPPATAWTDLTPKLRALSTSQGRQLVTTRVEPGATSVSLQDDTRDLEPEFAASPNYPNVMPNKLARCRATKSATTYDVCRFYIPSWPVSWQYRRASVDISGFDLMSVLATWPFSTAKDPTYTAELTSARINKILDRIGWPTGSSYRAIDTGQETVAAETVSDTTVLAYLQLLADSENGLFYIDPAGVATFHSRDHRTTATRSTVSQQTYGDAGSELPYTGLGMDDGAEQVWNLITVGWGPAGTTLVTANDFPSQRRGIRAMPARETRLSTSAAAQAQANTLLARLKDPHIRFTSLTIDPTRDAALWAAVLGSRLSDRITVKKRPYAGGAAISKDCFIEQIQHDLQNPLGGPQTWVTTLQLSTV